MIVKQLSPESRLVECKDLSALKDKGYTLTPFDSKTIDFLDQLSRRILKDSNSANRPELLALGFWLRKSQLNRIAKEQQTSNQSQELILSPVGVVFHICPTNVDTMFMYSMVISLLVGNKNILRISSRSENSAVLVLLRHINELMTKAEFSRFQEYINVITYTHDEQISRFLSLNCNARLIWGGDQTIQTFHKFETRPRTKDIIFADRVSISILGSSRLIELNKKDWENFVVKFYRDAYTFDQKGCSSPQIIYFLGDPLSNKEAIKLLEEKVSDFLESNYENDTASMATLKLNRMVDDSLAGILQEHHGSNLFKLVIVKNEIDTTSLQSCGGGYFYSKEVEDLSQLKNLSIPKVQTITHFGLNNNQITDLSELSLGEGIDRIVKLGNALKFDYIWDGYNLVKELSRSVYIER